MPRPVRPWFRFYTEAFSDRKLRRLKPEYRWLFAACLGAARQSPQPGALLVAEDVPMDAHDLADWAGMDVRTVNAGMRALTNLGLIVETSLGDRQEIVWSSPTFLDRQYESDNVTKRTRKHRATRDDTNVGTFQPSSQERSGNGGRNTPETETETETELTTPPPPKPRPVSSAKADGVEEFEGFWRAYPRKVGKAPAARAFKAARRKVDVATIADSLRVFSAAMAGRDPDKIPHPATWLNREPWHDDPDAIAPLPMARPASNGTGSFDPDRAMARALALEAAEAEHRQEQLA